MDKLIVCRCEEVDLDTLIAHAQQYDCSARELKLRTRAGMGYCGGRTCRTSIDALLCQLTGSAPGDDLPLKVQPPVRPVSLSTLGRKTES